MDTKGKILRLNEALNLDEKSIGKATKEIKVVIDIDRSVHAGERQGRSDNVGAAVSDDDIGTATKKAIPAIAKLLMLNKLKIGSDIVIQTRDHVNVVGSLQAHGLDIVLRVITVMRKPGFKPKTGTIPIRVA